VGIGSEKGILNRVFCVGSITQDAVCPSVQWGQATSENLIQLLSRPLFGSNYFALIRHVVCVWHALFLPILRKVFATRASIASSSKLELNPFNRLLVSLNSCLSAESVVSPHAL